mmetsp:Transcript_30527/g.76797  ORF Transcript_30527/g.76797 Transcript_30527/m.76797 type:complete len:141 (+) Transcript_30527:150-572(+)
MGAVCSGALTAQRVHEPVVRHGAKGDQVVIVISHDKHHPAKKHQLPASTYDGEDGDSDCAEGGHACRSSLVVEPTTCPRKGAEEAEHWKRNIPIGPQRSRRPSVPLYFGADGYAAKDDDPLASAGLLALAMVGLSLCRGA